MTAKKPVHPPGSPERIADDARNRRVEKVWNWLGFAAIGVFALMVAACFTSALWSLCTRMTP